MKTSLLVLSLLFSVSAFSSCEDGEGMGAIATSSTSPWFMTTFLMTGNDILIDCKIVKELRSDAQKALVEGVVSSKLAGVLEEMKNSEETANLSIDEKLELVINNTTNL